MQVASVLVQSSQQTIIMLTGNEYCMWHICISCSNIEVTTLHKRNLDVSHRPHINMLLLFQFRPWTFRIFPCELYIFTYAAYIITHAALLWGKKETYHNIYNMLLETMVVQDKIILVDKYFICMLPKLLHCQTEMVVLNMK